MLLELRNLFPLPRLCDDGLRPGLQLLLLLLPLHHAGDAALAAGGRRGLGGLHHGLGLAEGTAGLAGGDGLSGDLKGQGKILSKDFAKDRIRRYL